MFYDCHRIGSEHPSQEAFLQRGDGSSRGANRTGQSQGQCHRHLRSRAGPSAGPASRRSFGARRENRSAPRASRRTQGPDGHKRSPHYLWICYFQRSRSRRKRPLHYAHPAGRRYHRGQDQHRRVRSRIAYLQPSLWHNPQPVGYNQDQRGQQRRCGRSPRLRHGAAGGRKRSGGLVAQPGQFLQPGWFSSVSGAGSRLALHSWMVHPFRARPDGPDCAGHGPAAQRHGRI